VAERVHFVGEVHNNDLAPWYLASDVYALPSIARSEAFAIVQLEAMACGKPVVNTAIARSGVPFVSRDGESGLTVKVGDAEAFGRALGAILGDRELARRFGEAGRARVKREFSKEVMAERMLAVYQNVTTGRAARTSRERQAASATLGAAE
jgi:rhamnosyl/mannosyltransferase